MKQHRCDTICVSRFREGKGVSLILVMLSLLVLSVLAATIVFTARSETLASYNWKLDTQADYLAKAGIQYAANWLRSTRYQSVPPLGGTYTPDQAFNATASGGTFNTYTTNTSPVQCKGTAGTGCTAGSAVQLISIPNSTGSTAYPTGAVTTAVVTNFQADFPSGSSGGVHISTSSTTDSGVVYVNMVLLNYQSVENGTPPTLTPTAVETWQITARAYWTGASNTLGNSGLAVAEETAVVQPIYLPIWANAMYGYCSASMSGSSGTCTDAFNSALGAYASGNNATAASGCDSASSTNVIDSGAGVGANGFVSLGSNITVAGNVTIGSNPTGGATCCSPGTTPCTFQGSTTGVLGQVVAGPNVPPPAAPTFPPSLNTAPSPSWTGVTFVTYAQQCNTPTLTGTTGGTLSNGIYYYTVTALGAWGESSQAESAITLSGGINAVQVSWSTVTGATAYRVYRGTTSGGEGTYFQVNSPPITDLGTATSGGVIATAGSPPGGVAMWPQTMQPANTPTNQPQAGSSLTANGTYCYVVTALGSWGESAGGEMCSTAGTGNKKDIQFTIPGYSYGVPSNLKIYAGTAPGAENKLLATVAGNTTLWMDDGSLWGAAAAATPPLNRWSQFMSKTAANPPYFGCSAPCITGSSCDGTAANPFEINSVSMSNGDYLQFLGGKDIFHPTYYDIYDFQETGGSILVSGYIVLNIQNSMKIAGNGLANPLDYQSLVGLMVNVPPECVQINYAGTATAQVQGNGAVSAVITAPNATVQLGGGGSGGYMIGAIRALSVNMLGGYPLHYDVQLSKAGGTVGTMTNTAYSRRKM